MIVIFATIESIFEMYLTYVIQFETHVLHTIQSSQLENQSAFKKFRHIFIKSHTYGIKNTIHFQIKFAFIL